MAQISLFLDKRHSQEKYPIKLAVCHRGETYHISTGIKISPYDWVEDAQLVRNHPKKNTINSFLLKIMEEAESVMEDIYLSTRFNGIGAKFIRDRIRDSVFPDQRVEEKKLTFAEYYREFCNLRRKKSTTTLYMSAFRKIDEFMKTIKHSSIDKLKWDDITKKWLTEFQKFMLETCCLNTCNIHFRSLRAVFNDAIDNGETTNYPFRKFKLKTVRTRKRSLTVEDIRRLFSFDCEQEHRKYLDMFKLSFFLIGINMKDLYELKEINNGRVEYTRSKTYRPYSIMVEPEALELIERYKGEKGLINIADRYRNHLDFISRINKALKEIGPVKIEKHGKKIREPFFPELSTYWARHTWATIAASLDIPKDTIAAALGHGGNTVTDIYIDFDQHKVDEANRRVLDWVLYNKR